MQHLVAASQTAPHPETRAAVAEVTSDFLDGDRIQASLEQLHEGGLPLEVAAQLWGWAGERAWDPLIDFWAALPEGKLREEVAQVLRKRLAVQPDLLRGALRSPDAAHVKGALALLDPTMETAYAAELLTLPAHPDEAIRLKGLAAAGRLGGSEAMEIVWKAIQADPSKSVRLFAFRLAAARRFPGLGQRLVDLVVSPAFASRPTWEREKYVRLLGAVAGEQVLPLFEAWLPEKRWMWQQKDLDQAELALVGLAACGGKGLARVQELAAGGGKLGTVAQKVVEASRRGWAESAGERR